MSKQVMAAKASVQEALAEAAGGVKASHAPASPAHRSVAHVAREGAKMGAKGGQNGAKAPRKAAGRASGGKGKKAKKAKRFPDRAFVLCIGATDEEKYTHTYAPFDTATEVHAAINKQLTKEAIENGLREVIVSCRKPKKVKAVKASKK